MTRSQKIINRLNNLRIDGLLLSADANVSYAAGFETRDTYALLTPRRTTLITDFRYAGDYAQKVKPPVYVLPYKTSLFHTIIDAARAQKCRSIGFESRHLAFAECELLHDLKMKGMSFMPFKETIEPLRMVKEKGELDRIRKGLLITLAAYQHIRPLLKPGRTELEIAGHIEKFIRRQGASSTAFETIIASGPNSSYPHARASSRKLKTGEPVVIDMGVVYNGYKCDLTRTFFLGKIPAYVQKAALVVKEAQSRAIRIIKPGVPLKEIDAAARNYIRDQGFGEHFGHALGHGVGLEVHEAPSISQKQEGSAQEGMVFTVEPGIYLAGRFGIRMEEMVLVTSTGVEVLSGRP